MSRPAIVSALACLFLLPWPAWGAPLPVPDEGAQKAAQDIVREALKDEYTAAKTTAAKRKLAEKMISLAVETKDSPAQRFMLARIARDLAAQNGDLDTANRAIDLLDEGFEIDAIAMRIEMLEKVVDLASVEESAKVADYGLQLAEGLADKDRFVDAVKAADAAAAAARKTKNAGHLAKVKALKDGIGRFAKAQEKLGPYEETLKAKPTDPEANLEVGKFYALYRGDFARAIPLLALGEDDAFAPLAQRELAADAKALGTLANDWLALAEKQPPEARTSLRQHALELLVKSQAALSGLEKKVAGQKIDDLEASLPPPKKKVAVAKLHVFEGHRRGAFSPNKVYLATVHNSGTIHLWNYHTLREVRVFTGHNTKVGDLKFSQDGTRIFAADDTKLRVWDVAKGSEIKAIDAPHAPEEVFVSSDARRVTLGWYHDAWTIDVALGKVVKPYHFGNGDMWLKDMNDDGRLGVVSGFFNELRVYDMVQNKHIGIPTKSHNYASHLSRDGRFALTGGGDGIVHVFDVATKREIASYAGLEGHVYGITLQPDGKRLLGSGGNGRLCLWDVKTGKLLHSYADTKQPNKRPAFGYDGRHALSVVNDKDVWLWGLPE